MDGEFSDGIGGGICPRPFLWAPVEQTRPLLSDVVQQIFSGFVIRDSRGTPKPTRRQLDEFWADLTLLHTAPGSQRFNIL